VPPIFSREQFDRSRLVGVSQAYPNADRHEDRCAIWVRPILLFGGAQE